MTLESRKDNIAAVDFRLSNEVVQLYEAAAIRNVNEAVAVLFHALLLESGFIPKDASDDDIYKSMPKDWNAGGIFKLKYSHYCCTSLTYVTFVPLSNNISIHGIVCDTICSESVDLKMNLSKYIKQKKNLSNIYEVFKDVDELSRYFKDNFCLPLLNLLHETIGVQPLYGFPGLYDDLKICILMLLPVESIVSMSSVNKNLYNLVNLPYVWKYLYMRDYGKDGVPEIERSSRPDWKELYKKEYQKKKRRSGPRHYTLPYYNLPQILGRDYHFPHIFDPRPRLPPIFGPDVDTDFGYDFDPPFPNLSPSSHLHDPSPLLSPPKIYMPPLLPFRR